MSKSMFHSGLTPRNVGLLFCLLDFRFAQPHATPSVRLYGTNVMCVPWRQKGSYTLEPSKHDKPRPRKEISRGIDLVTLLEYPALIAYTRAPEKSQHCGVPFALLESSWYLRCVKDV
uniref:Putative secreted protein n=1 Tax=Rhipicephalus microplus TaxID=6941 RepID=A0A6G5A140_RHIMP